MKAAIYEYYGPPEVLKVREIACPDLRDDQILIKTFATTVTSADWRARSLRVPHGFGLVSRLAFGVFGPRRKVLGTELAGRVEALGNKVTNFKVGEDVIGFTGMAMGCHAEYVAMPATGKVARKPGNLTFAEASALSFAGTTALDFLRTKGKIKSDEDVLIIGASGAIGTSAVQIAKHFGANVTGVCSTSNVQLVSSLGADHVVDYTQKDISRAGKEFDIVFDTVGALPLSKIRGMLRHGGRGLLAAGSLLDNLKAPFLRLVGDQNVFAGVAQETPEDLYFLVDLAARRMFKPVIDRVYSLEQIRDAHAYVGTGRKKGNVVIEFVNS